MVSLLITFLIAFWATFIVVGIGRNVIEARDRRRAAIEASKLQLTDGEGFRLQYDAHYTRDLEDKEGIAGKRTQCADDTCNRCYWKARYFRGLIPFDGAYHTLKLPKHVRIEFNKKEREFVESLVDGMSDELYEGLLEDYRAEVRPQMEEIAAKAKELELQNKADMNKKAIEHTFRTPMAMIRQYQAEGRTYNAATNTWSRPKDEPSRADWESIGMKATRDYIDSANDWAEFHFKDASGNTFVAPSKEAAKRHIDRMIAENRKARLHQTQKDFDARIKEIDRRARTLADEVNRMNAKAHKTTVLPKRRLGWETSESNWTDEDWDDGTW